LHHHSKFYNDEKERRKWQNPEAILPETGVKKGSIFVDVGCGEGFFAVPAARIVGKNGKVYALDIDEESIAILRKKAAKEGLTNLETRVGAAEEIVLCEACADFVFFGIVLHDFRNVPKVLQNIRFTEAQAAGLLDKAGFEVEEAKERGLYHYLILAKPH
jgi:ubiquinone/menaquinone biosynthesis C-methylase UbiE